MKRSLWLMPLVLLALLSLPAALGAAEEPSKPNLVFLLADNLRPDCLGVLGHPVVKTPHLDRLCQQGFIFRHAYALGSSGGAVGMPSRTMLQTALSYLHKDRTAPTLAETIHAAGYASIRSGKFGNNPSEPLGP